MNPIETIGPVLGTGFSSGLNLYGTIAALGLLQRLARSACLKDCRCFRTSWPSESPSGSMSWNFSRTGSRTSTRSDRLCTLLFARLQQRCRLRAYLVLLPNGGAGPPPCPPAASHPSLEHWLFRVQGRKAALAATAIPVCLRGGLKSCRSIGARRRPSPAK
jgi:hypothetical protein